MTTIMPTPEEESTQSTAAETLADYLVEFIGILDSGEHTPGGAQMSHDCGGKFAEGMVRKRQEGHL